MTGIKKDIEILPSKRFVFEESSTINIDDWDTSSETNIDDNIWNCDDVPVLINTGSQKHGDNDDNDVIVHNNDNNLQSKLMLISTANDYNIACSLQQTIDNGMWPFVLKTQNVALRETSLDAYMLRRKQCCSRNELNIIAIATCLQIESQQTIGFCYEQVLIGKESIILACLEQVFLCSCIIFVSSPLFFQIKLTTLKDTPFVDFTDDYHTQIARLRKTWHIYKACMHGHKIAYSRSSKDCILHLIWNMLWSRCFMCSPTSEFALMTWDNIETWIMMTDETRFEQVTIF